MAQQTTECTQEGEMRVRRWETSKFGTTLRYGSVLDPASGLESRHRIGGTHNVANGRPWALRNISGKQMLHTARLRWPLTALHATPRPAAPTPSVRAGKRDRSLDGEPPQERKHRDLLRTIRIIESGYGGLIEMRLIYPKITGRIPSPDGSYSTQYTTTQYTMWASMWVTMWLAVTTRRLVGRSVSPGTYAEGREG